MDSAEQKRTTEVPVVYKLIESNAPADDIAAQIIRDAKPGNDAAEKMFLGFDELLRRGEEGKRALQLLKDSGAYCANAAKELIEEGSIDRESLEGLLEIERWGERITPKDSEDFLQSLDSRIREMRYSHKSASQLFEEQYVLSDILDLHPHMDELLDNAVVSDASTFGTSEPIYLELLGPREILRLRSLREGRFLLLGSYGKYSAQEFAQYANKINPRVETHVVDIDENSVEAIQNNQSEGQGLARADARMLPFAPNTFDHIYTNNLFHFLRSHQMFQTLRTRWDTSTIFAETYAALKPGGSFILEEPPYGRFNKPGGDERMRKDIFARAGKVGYEVAATLNQTFAFPIVFERGSSTIDKNGFPHYENGLVADSGGETDYTLARFVKPEAA